MTCAINKYYSYNQKPLPPGCQHCVRGKKTVLFVTGFCPRKCFYCPVSTHKMYKDVQYANERPITDVNGLIDEIKQCQSTGIGITGGDPLVKLDRVCQYMKTLKKEFGRGFHIHLYTSLNLLSEDTIKALVDAGLDELRVHPDVYNKKNWDKLELLKLFDGKTGIEIPAIPGQKEAIQEIFDKAPVDFFVLNELEYSEAHEKEYAERKLFCNSPPSYAIKGSKQMSLQLIENNPTKKIHFCTAKLKDATQLTNRLKLQAETICQPYQYLTGKGTIMKGILHDVNAKELEKHIRTEFDVPKELLHIVNDTTLEVAPWVLIEIKPELSHKATLVTEYPSYDKFVVAEEEL